MSRHLLPPDAVQTLTPELIRRYLQSQGWELGREYPRTEVWATVLDGERAEVVLPKDPRLLDFTSQVQYLFGSLEAFEDRDPVEILHDVTSATVDSYYAQLFPRGHQPGTIPLPEGTRAFSAFRDLFVSATFHAMTVHDGRPLKPVEPIRKQNEVYDFLSRVRLGLTRPGSYILTAELPINLPVPEQLRLDQEGRAGGGPLPRRVSTALHAGTKAAWLAASGYVQGADPGVFEEHTQQGLTANLCESLVNLSSSGRVPFGLRVAWANTLEPEHSTAALRFDRGLLEALQIGAEHLRSRYGQQGVQVRGTVVKLEREPTSGPGAIVLLGRPLDDPTGRARRIHLELTSSQYDLALRAHGEGQELIAQGDLERDVARWRLVGLQSLAAEEPSG